MVLTFKNSIGNEKILGNFKTEEEAMQRIADFLEEHNFKSYYTRVVYRDGCRVIDVGSWTEFFILYDEGYKGDLVTQWGKRVDN